MESFSINLLRQYADTDCAEIVDSRAYAAEVIRIPLRQHVLPTLALSATADNLASFLEQVTGRGYQKAEELYSGGFMVREPGRESYGLRVMAEGGNIIVSRVALLEDDTVFQRYVNYLRTGVYV